MFRRLPPLPARQPCALTIGNFDGVHRGHQSLIDRLVDQARAADLPATVLTFEPHPREYFAARSPAAMPAPRRVATLRDKLEALAGLGVDRVCVAHFNAALAAMPAEAFVNDILVDGLRTRHLLIGDDFCFGARRRGDFAMLTRLGRESGMQVEAMPTITEDGLRVSSSRVREALMAGDLTTVERLLGRPYQVSGHVIHGRKLGRNLGFPTLNLRFAHGQPALAGIFVVEVDGLHVNGSLPGVASLGTRPAVETDGRPLLEVHLLDWQGDAYGKLVRVTFRQRLRDELPFESLEALRIQIDRDANAARAWFAGRGPTR